MATTFNPIQSITTTGNTQSVTFSSIPQTYTDLCLKMTVRSVRPSSYYDDALIYFNGTASGDFFTQNIQAFSSTITSTFQNYSGYGMLPNAVVASSGPANYFSPLEYYISDYTNTAQRKSLFINGGQTMTGATRYIYYSAGKSANTSAVTSITVLNNYSDYPTGCKFDLYGILKA